MMSNVFASTKLQSGQKEGDGDKLDFSLAQWSLHTLLQKYVCLYIEVWVGNRVIRMQCYGGLSVYRHSV